MYPTGTFSLLWTIKDSCFHSSSREGPKVASRLNTADNSRGPFRANLRQTAGGNKH